MIWDMLRGEFVDVIDWTDETRDTLVWRFQRRGNAIKYGAKLTVREGQAACFVHEGQLADVFGPGLYMLETNNMPVMTTLQHWDHGFDSPFKSEVYFVSTRPFLDLKWGTQNPVTLRDAEFGAVRLRAFGTYGIRVSDPGVFLKEVVGTDGEVTTDEVTGQLRALIATRFGVALASSGVPVLDLAANTEALARFVADRIAPDLTAQGLQLTQFLVENVSLPEAVEQALDRRTAMGVVGDLDRYAQFQAAEAMRAAAENPGGAGAGMGAGIGMGLGIAMAGGAGPWGARPAAPPSAAPAAAPPPPPPPPPPGGAVWHVAENGATRGPFVEADLAQMARAGTLTAATLVWAQGFAGWTPAGDVGALAGLFPPAPPPPPPSA